VGHSVVKFRSQVARPQFHDLNLTLFGVIMIVGHGLSMGLKTNTYAKYQTNNNLLHYDFYLIIQYVSCFHPSIKGFCGHLTDGFGTVYL